MTSSAATTRALLQAGDALAYRLTLYKKLAIQAKEQGDSRVELPVQALYEGADEAAIQRWESAKASATGQNPLFPEVDHEPA
jgi:hypothetical protein